MANFIEELYYGIIDPQARGYRPKSPVKKVSDSLNNLEEKLTEQLASENKELFLFFCNAYAEFMGECELDTFITGFRLGARFIMDTFLSDKVPFESFLEGWEYVYGPVRFAIHSGSLFDAGRKLTICRYRQKISQNMQD